METRASARRLRVVFLQRSIPPDHSAAGRLLLDLAEGLDPRRFEPIVLATRVPADSLREETVAGVRIVRAGRGGFTRRSLAGRLRGLTGAWAALAGGLKRVGRPDVLVTLTDPPLSVVLGAMAAKAWGCRHVHWAQDFYPEVPAAGGVVSENSVVYRVLEAMAESALRSCDAVVTIGRCMAERLARRGIESTVIPNWARLDPRGASAGRATEFRRQLGGDGKLLLLYSGNLGLVHDFETLLAGAERLEARAAPVAIGLAGTGPREAWLRDEVSRRKLRNIRFLASQTWDDFPSLLAAADAHLVTLRADFGGLVVPSKVYDAAASGRPVIFIGPRESEVAKAIEEHGFGRAISNAAAGTFADTVEDWARDRTQLGDLGLRAAAFARTSDRASALSAFSTLLERVAIGRGEEESRRSS